MYGAFILEQNYKINASARAGVVGYNLNDTFMLFGSQDETGAVSANSSAFHCWVEADGWLIDFMAPAFPRLFAAENRLPSKMLQKPLSMAKDSLDEVDVSGDFFVAHSPELTLEMTQHMASAAMFADLAHIANAWFRKAPKKMKRFAGVSKGAGKPVQSVELVGTPLSGTW